MIDDKKLKELLALAKKATQGKRSWKRESNSLKTLSTNDGKDIISSDEYAGSSWLEILEKDAEFVAVCDPETIRALVEEVRNWRAQAKGAAWRRIYDSRIQSEEKPDA